MLHIPKGVRHYVRQESMFPYEVMDKGLKRYTGNTVNANTKKNKELR